MIHSRLPLEKACSLIQTGMGKTRGDPRWTTEIDPFWMAGVLKYAAYQINRISPSLNGALKK